MLSPKFDFTTGVAVTHFSNGKHLFHDSIANNIAIAKPGATREEIMEAAKKASIHDFIMTLPNGYDTEVGELGDTLSGGEKQRIGIARAFLHDASMILLDEPTSNLDSLNEGIILKSLKESAEEKTNGRRKQEDAEKKALGEKEVSEDKQAQVAEAQA